jgi:hypothetical protein
LDSLPVNALFIPFAAGASPFTSILCNRLLFEAPKTLTNRTRKDTTDPTARKATRDQGAVYQGIRSGSFGCHEEPRDIFGRTERLFSNCSASELSNRGKLLKARRGEVAERLNAAVC